MQGDSQQVCGSHVPRRQWPVEHPGFLLQRAGAVRRHPDPALARRVDLPVASEHSRQQRNGLAVLGPERQHRVAVAAPPRVFGPESHAPGAYARRIENVDEADRSIGGARASWNREVDPLTAADDVQGIRQSRVLGPGIPVDRQVMDVEEPLPCGFFGRAAARCPGAFEIRIVDHGQSAVQALQGRKQLRETRRAPAAACRAARVLQSTRPKPSPCRTG